MKSFFSFSLLGLACLLFSPTTSTYAQDTSYKAFSEPFIQSVKKAAPGVVSIKVQINRKMTDEQIDPFDDDFWNHFFNMPQQSQNPKAPRPADYALGSGFIVSSDGYILTNNHVVEDATKILVQLPDGREFEAKTIGGDSSTDIALIKINSTDLPFLTLADSSTVEIGEWVLAIGNALGLQATVTSGVISAKGRSDLNIAPVEEFFQTDAAINRGNSGGPLINLQGEVVGMNTLIISNTGGYMGIGFAISSNLLKEVMKELKENGKLNRGFLGLSLQPIDANLSSALGMNQAKGALVADVLPDSPAEKAGVKSGDVILKVNGIEIETAGGLRKSTSLMKPGQKVDLSILRSGKLINLTATIGAYPNDEKKATTLQQSFGMSLEPVNAENAKRFNLTTTTGLLVVQLDPQGLAYEAGIRPGAIIVAVNGKPVATLEEFSSICSSVEKGKKILLQVRVGAHNRYVSLPIE